MKNRIQNRILQSISILTLLALSFSSWAKQCYTLLENDLGYTVPPDAVNEVACDLLTLIPMPEADNFGVFSGSLYRYSNIYQPEFIPMALSRMQAAAEATKPYYILFAWESIGDNLFAKLHIVLKLPDTGVFSCSGDIKNAALNARLNELVYDHLPVKDKPADYILAEIEALKALLAYVQKAIECCSPLKAKRDLCSDCPSEEDLQAYKNSLGFHTYPAEGGAVSLPNFTASFEPEVEAHGTSVSTDYIKVPAIIDGNSVDINAIFEEYVQLPENNGCQFKLYLTTDAQFCGDNASLFTSDGISTISNINFKPLPGGGYELDYREVNKQGCGSFVEYLFKTVLGDVDYDAAFVVDYYVVVIPVLQPTLTNYNCYLAPSGAMIDRVDIRNPYFADVSDKKFPAGTLTSFEFKNETYIAIRVDLDNGKFDFRDYYPKSDMPRIKKAYEKENPHAEENAPIPKKYFDSQKYFSVLNPEKIRNSECRVYIQLRGECTIGEYAWDRQPTTTQLWGKMINDPTPPENADHKSHIKYGCALCEVGQNFLKTNLPLAKEGEASVIQDIAVLMCQMGESLFGMYVNNSWDKFPDFMQHQYEVYGKCEGCSYTATKAALLKYKARYEEILKQVNDAGQSGWKMASVINALNENEIAALDYDTRIYAVEKLAELRELEYGRSDRKTEETILKLITSISPENDKKCLFIGALKAKTDLLNKIFHKFNDVAFWVGGYDNYLEFVTHLEKLITSCNKDRLFFFSSIDLSKKETTEILRLGEMIYNESGVSRNCPPILSYDPSGTKFTIKLASGLSLRYNSEPRVVGADCDYSKSKVKEIKVENPFDYVLVYASSSHARLDLQKGQYYAVPAFMLRYFADDAVNEQYRENIVRVLEAGAIALSAGYLGVAEGTYAIIWGVFDLLTTTSFFSFHESIRNGELREYFDNEEDYNKFVESTEEVFAWLGVAAITGSAYTAMHKSIEDSFRHFSKSKFRAGLDDRLRQNALDRLYELASKAGVNGVGPWMDDVFDIQKSVFNQNKNIIANMSSSHKGAWGEIATDAYLTEKGFQPLHPRKTALTDGWGETGIDGIFKKDGQYYIIEAKYTGYSTLNNTIDGKQLSNGWIEGSNRLRNAVGETMADEIKLLGYKKIWAKVAPDGTITFKEAIDDFANTFIDFIP